MDINWTNVFDWMILLKSFITGGIICIIGQILIDKTKLTPARIVFSYEVFNKNNMDKSINTGYTVHAIVNKEMKPINTKKLFPEIYEAMEKMAQ